MATRNDKNKNKQLYYLNELSDYKISDDDPDVRGWDVKDADNRVIGKVDNLLVNKNTERVVYLDVEVDSSIIEANHDPYGKPANEDVHEFINKDGENHIIIPVGMVSLNEDQDFVYTDKINHQTFAETKRFEKGSSVNREYEVVVLNSYSRDRDDRNRDREERSRDRDSDSRSIDPRDKDRKDSAFDERNDVRDRQRDADSSLEERDDDRRRDWDDDDSFYERREFDGSNYRRRR